MSKRKNGTDTRREQKLEKRISIAQEHLARAQEKRVLAVRKGEVAVEKARAEAARTVSTATARVEKRASELAHLEARLNALRAPTPPTQLRPESPQAPTPQVAADELEAELAPTAERMDVEEKIVVPQAPNAPIDSQLDGTVRNETDLYY